MVNENELWYVIGFGLLFIWGLAINMALDDWEIERDLEKEIEKSKNRDEDIDDGCD